MKYKISALFTFFLFFCLTAFSQKVTNKGKEFYVSFYKNFQTTQCSVLLTSSVNTSGIIVNPNTTYSQPFTITAGSVTQITVPNSEAYNQVQGLNNLGLIITSADSIGVYALSNYFYSSDATTVIPKPALGTEYMIASYTSGNNLHPSCFLIEATEDNTTVQITTSTHANGNVAGVPFSTTLNKGQTFYVTADNSSGVGNDDISGSTVTVTNGCKPIAVFAGVEMAEVTWGMEASDILYEQLFPVSSFGRQFIMLPLRGRNAYKGRVYAAYDNTQVNIDGALSSTINKGQFYDFISQQNLPLYTTTSQPAEVMQFALSQEYDEMFGPTNEGDPTMMTVPPLEQQLKQSVFLSPQMGAINSHKVSIVCKTTDAFNTVLDGINVGASFTVVSGNPLYSYASFDIGAGQHAIINNRGFVSYAYGFGDIQGYGYCTGSSVENISTYFTCNQVSSITHPTIDVCTGVQTFNIITSDANTNFKWDFGDGTIINTAGTVLQQTHNYAAPGTYLVKLVNTKSNTNNACSTLNTDSSYLTLQVSTNLVPLVSITSSPANPICTGSTNVNFIATPVNEGTTPVYQWKKNGVVVGGNTQILNLPTIAAGDQISCTLTSSITCATVPTATADMTVQLANPTVPTVTITASAETTCEGSSVNFTALTGSNYQNVQYQWKLNGNNVGTNQNTYSIVPANGDVVTCVITVNSYCIAPNTATSNAKTITVLPAINVAAVQIAASQNPVCANTAISFTATPTLGGTNPVYQWKLNGVNTGTNSTTYTVPLLQNGDVVTCIMTSNSPVVCNQTATSNTITMQVNAAVTPAISIAASKNNICPGDQVTFTATPVNGGTAPVYQWTINGVNAGTNANVFTSTILQNNDVVNCSIISNVTCLAVNGPVASNNITIIVSTAAAPAISITATKINICQGDAVMFTALPLNANATTTYQWKLNSSNVGTGATAYTSNTLQDKDTVYCKMTTVSACAATPTITSNKIIMQVSPVVMPAISITATKTTICQDDVVTFTAAPINPGTAPVYQWKLNGTTVGTGTTVYTSATLNNNDVVSCSLLTSLPCPTVAGAIESNPVTIKVNPVVTPTISISADKTPVCKGDNVTITATTTNGGTNPAYQWMQNGAIVNNSSNSYSSVNFTDGDKISCKLTSSIVCALPASSNDFVMTVKPVPSVLFNPSEAVVTYGNSYQMQPVITGNVTNYLWTPATQLSSSNIPRPIVTAQDNQLYTLTVTNTSDCSASAKMNIIVFKDFKMPNAFVPGGKNSVFMIPHLYQSITIHYFRIFNRYGQKIFETKEPSKGWDGTWGTLQQPGGAYIWMVEYEHPITKQTILAQGSVVMIR